MVFMWKLRLQLGASLLITFFFLSLFSSLTSIPEAEAFTTYQPIVDSSSNFNNPTYSLLDDSLEAYTSPYNAWIIWDLLASYDNVSAFEIKGQGGGTGALNPLIQVSTDKATWHTIAQDTWRDYTPSFWRTIYIDPLYSTVRYIKGTFSTNMWYIDAVRCRTYPYVYIESGYAWANHYVSSSGIQNSLGTGISKKDASSAGNDYFQMDNDADFIEYEYPYIISSSAIFIDKGTGVSGPVITLETSLNGVSWTTAGTLTGATETSNFNGKFKFLKLTMSNVTGGAFWQIIGIRVTVMNPVYLVTVTNGTYGTTTNTGVYYLGTGEILTLTATPMNSSYKFDYFSNNGTHVTTNPFIYTCAGPATVLPVFKVYTPVIYPTIGFMLPIMAFIIIGGIALILIKGRKND